MRETLNLNKIKIFFKKLPGISAEKTFLTFLGLSLFAFLFGGFVFYKYAYLAEKTIPKASENFVKIEEKAYQDLLDFWDSRTKKIEESNSKRYINPFQEIREEMIEAPAALSESENTSKEETLTKEKIEELKKAATLYEFYKIKGGDLPLINERAKIWEIKGLGNKEDYQGFYDQNKKLLEEFKKELAQ
jgi:hypothetical protein